MTNSQTFRISHVWNFLLERWANLVSEPLKKPLTANEIEALLRSSREGEFASRSDVVSNEPLGPGDVQHLRNMAFDEPPLVQSDWPFDVVSADELLHQAENHLAQAMSSDTIPAPESKPQPPFEFPPLPTKVEDGPISVSLETIGDIELDVSLELGQAELTIEELLALREGSVVTLDRAAGDPIDILANGRLIARGEVVVIDNKFCVRICEVVGK